MLKSAGACFVACAIAVSSSFSSTWEKSCLDSCGSSMHPDVHIAVGNNSLPYILFNRTTEYNSQFQQVAPGGLYLFKKNTSGWEKELADSLTNNAKGFAITSDNKLHFVYYYSPPSTTHYLVHRVKDGDIWNSTVIDSFSTTVGEALQNPISIARGSNGAIHLIYGYCSNVNNIMGTYRLVYKLWDGTQWPAGADTLPVKGPLDEEEVSITTNDNNLHIILPQLQLSMYCIKSNSTWSVADTLPFSIGWAPHLFLKNGTSPVIVQSSDDRAPTLQYAEKVDTGWTQEHIADSSGWNPAAAIDNKGNIHVVYKQEVMGSNVRPLKYLTNKNGTWEVEIIHPNTDNTIDKYDIAVDNNEGVYICFLEQIKKNGIPVATALNLYTTNVSSSHIISEPKKSLAQGIGIQKTILSRTSLQVEGIYQPSATVTLTLYDLRGRVLAVSEKVQCLSDGTFTASCDVKHSGAGAYVFMLSSGGERSIMCKVMPQYMLCP